MGVSRVQSSDWQKLADLPEPEFEKRLKDPAVMPTTKGTLTEPGEPPQRVVQGGGIKTRFQKRTAF
jgi:hypothetical protein